MGRKKKRANWQTLTWLMSDIQAVFSCKLGATRWMMSVVVAAQLVAALADWSASGFWPAALAGLLAGPLAQVAAAAAAAEVEPRFGVWLWPAGAASGAPEPAGEAEVAAAVATAATLVRWPDGPAALEATAATSVELAIATPPELVDWAERLHSSSRIKSQPP